jgi:hypothetical protein
MRVFAAPNSSCRASLAGCGEAGADRDHHWFLRVDPEKLTHPRRLIGGGHVAVIPLAGNSLALRAGQK